MGEHTITLTETDEKILESFWPTVGDALESIINRQLKIKGKELIHESSSRLDPRKLDKAEREAELAKVQADIKTYAERNPETETIDQK